MASRGVAFRSDIQGMRALAVLAIMLYHAHLSPYPGGFVTLDVFFVVSGFLITSLLIAELRRDGTVSLRKFYARRARRILPAVTVATVGTLVAAFLWQTLVEARETAVDAVWAAFFGANIRFAVENTDYFADTEPPSPLQHYWSLSVEEQFYVVLPLLFVCSAAWVMRRRRAGDSLPEDASLRMVVATLGALTLAGLTWSVYASYESPETAYFSTLTRTWEFGVGGLLAAVPARFPRALTARARNLVAGVGLAAIVLACFIVTPETAFPGYAALLPVLGTGAVMIAGAEMTGRTPVVQRMLGTAPMRLIGDASYSLYLWHWPVFVIARQQLERDLRPGEIVAAFVVVFAVSFASYRLVETPFRRARRLTLRPALALYPVGVAIVVALAGLTVVQVDRELQEQAGDEITTARFGRTVGGRKLSGDRHEKLVQASARAAKEAAAIPTALTPELTDLKKDKASVGDCEYDAPPWDRCRRGDEDADRTLVLLGNSHGRHWIPALEKLAEEHGYAAYYFVKPACTPARVVSVARNLDEPWDECTDFNEWAEEQVADLEPELVVITGSAPRKVIVDGEATNDSDVMLDEMRQGFEEVVRDMVAHTRRPEDVVMLGDVPRRNIRPADCLGERDATLKDCLDRPKRSADRIREASKEAAEEVGARYVGPARWFCAEGLCPAVVGETITMRDQGHITTAYSEQLAKPLGRALGVAGDE